MWFSAPSNVDVIWIQSSSSWARREVLAAWMWPMGCWLLLYIRAYLVGSLSNSGAETHKGAGNVACSSSVKTWFELWGYSEENWLVNLRNKNKSDSDVASATLSGPINIRFSSVWWVAVNFFFFTAHAKKVFSSSYKERLSFWVNINICWQRLTSLTQSNVLLQSL